MAFVTAVLSACELFRRRMPKIPLHTTFARDTLPTRRLAAEILHVTAWTYLARRKDVKIKLSIHSDVAKILIWVA